MSKHFTRARGGRERAFQMAGGNKMQGNIVIGNLACLKKFTVNLKQVRSLCRLLSNVFVL